MAVKISAQHDYFETQATVDPKCNVADVSDILRALKTNCRMTVLYNGGAVQAISIEVHAKLKGEKSKQVRKLLDLESIFL